MTHRRGRRNAGPALLEGVDADGTGCKSWRHGGQQPSSIAALTASAPSSTHPRAVYAAAAVSLGGMAGSSQAPLRRLQQQRCRRLPRRLPCSTHVVWWPICSRMPSRLARCCKTRCGGDVAHA
eukprot:355105-Chlamydomonas_euryale.AAC.10